METFYHLLRSLGYTHPVHPTMVSLPIGCIMAAFIFGTIAVLCDRPGFAASARHCLTLALVAVFPTIFLGYLDWHHFFSGNWLFPIRMKIALAGSLLALLACTVFCAWKSDAKGKGILALHALCFLNVAAIGYFGGELVFAGFKPQRENVAASPAAPEQPSASLTTYADVAEVFQQICSRCHRGPDAPYGLQLDTYEHALAGGLEGKVIIPGKPDESELVLRIKGLSRPAMPYGMAPLPADKIAAIERWIAQGARMDAPAKKPATDQP